MTTTKWTDERLDKLADDVRGNTTAVTDLRATAEALLQTVTIYQSNFEVIIGEIQDIKTEIRGLQLENRRMLEELRGDEPTD